MNKFIISSIVILMAQMSFADCLSSTIFYSSESDDVGVELPLKLSCPTGNQDVCVYMGNGFAKITGTQISGNELTRQKIAKSGSTLNISLKTSVADSILDYRYINFAIDLKTLKGAVASGGRGLNPYNGVVVTPEEVLSFQCSKN